MARSDIAWLAGAAGLLLAFALTPMVFTGPFFRMAMGDLVPLLAVLATTIVFARNTRDSRGYARLFWGLMTAGAAMWSINQACWAWYEIVIRKPLPDPFVGDIVLFLHVVPIMAAVAIRPYQADEREGMLQSTLNVLILLVWWIVVYAFFVFPEEYIVTNVEAYTPRWDFLYLAEGVILIATSASAYFASFGPWRQLYRDIFFASALYTVTSAAMNAAVASGTYQTGGFYDLPFLASVLGFLWVGLKGRRCLRDIEMAPGRPIAPILARLALFSLPIMGYWALFLSNDSHYLRHLRFAVTMGGFTLLALVVLFKQHLLDQTLLQLLEHSRKSLDNLVRLQGRVIQQTKLASLGELVALAAGELECPLSAILDSSERMAASSNLTREQLAHAQKIGQQAQRTRALVNDLLSFAQQTPGEKSPLDLKPLLQRALQMEGFKLENRKISLTVESNDPSPMILGNANQLLQAFLQIVENAVEALQEVGGGTLQVSLWRDAGELVIQFADSGPGLRDP
ncbi:MAG: HAMP domain-containing sensor histidine kinase, partial [Terriglobales bacterium]